MGQIEDAVSNAKVVSTDIRIKNINSDSGLRVGEYLNELEKTLPPLEKAARASIFSKLRDAMVEDEEDVQRQKALRKAVDLIYQLENCLNCRCITCGMIDARCRCEGCLYGCRVTDCDGGGGIETRRAQEGVCFVDGMPVTLLQYGRATRETTVTLADRNGVETRYLFDPASGKKLRID